MSMTRADIYASRDYVRVKIEAMLSDKSRTVESCEGGYKIYTPRADKISTKGIYYFVEYWIKE